MWEIVFDSECWDWFLTLPEGLQEEIWAGIHRLEEIGPRLGRPLVDTLKGSRIKNLKEMRVEFERQPYRLLFAFAPDRRGILLVGGSKATDKRWYQRAIATAETRYERWRNG